MRAEKVQLQNGCVDFDDEVRGREGSQHEPARPLRDLFPRIPELGHTVCIVEEFITPDEETGLLEAIYSRGDAEWHQLTRRRLQMFGGTPDAQGTVREPLPPFLADLSRRLAATGVFPGSGFDQVLLNEYTPPQGIAPHRDGPLFRGRVAILSLCLEATMVFSRDQAGTLTLALTLTLNLTLTPTLTLTLTLIGWSSLTTRPPRTWWVGSVCRRVRCCSSKATPTRRCIIPSPPSPPLCQ